MDELTQIQARVLACLMEKEETTPDQYPLTLNFADVCDGDELPGGVRVNSPRTGNAFAICAAAIQPFEAASKRRDECYML